MSRRATALSPAAPGRPSTSATCDRLAVPGSRPAVIRLATAGLRLAVIGPPSYDSGWPRLARPAINPGCL